jgi:hypothetical protein
MFPLEIGQSEREERRGRCLTNARAAPLYV